MGCPGAGWREVGGDYIEPLKKVVPTCFFVFFKFFSLPRKNLNLLNTLLEGNSLLASRKNVFFLT